MSKKQNFSHIAAQEALESVTSTLTAENLPYQLLSIFCGYGDASLQRVRDGRDNKSRDPHTILVKDKIVYRPFRRGTEPMDVIITLRNDASVTRHNPRLYITCDGSSLVAYDPKDDDLYDGTLETLWRDFEFFKPLAGIEKFRNYEEAEADVKSAELMAKIYDDICRYNDFRDPEVSHSINVFMSRLLFCFFAEDTGLFKDNQFTKAIEDNTAIDGSDLADFIDRLFVIMSTDDKTLREQQTNKVIADFPYVNGGLFLQRYPIPVLSRRARLLMIQCGKYQWSEINPDIFGSMTQAIVSPEDRAELGIHYTSVPNIMKVIQPLFLDDLAAEFLRSRNDAKALNALLVRMSKIKFFDPACGSGNFLIIAYKRLRELEIEIWKRLVELGSPMLPFSDIALTQFYGIEIDEYACDTATLSLWLAEHQMNNKFREQFGASPNPLPLRPSGHIVCGNACTTDWNTVCPHTKEEEVYVMGNPPYKGYSGQTNAQKNEMDFVYQGFTNYRKLDYISCWFTLASRYIQGTQAKYAFVSTNSITQGEQVSILWPDILGRDLEIFFAYPSFYWSNNAKHNAQVAVVIIGIQNSKEKSIKRLYTGKESRIVRNINPYLIESDNIFITGHSESISGFPEMIKGSAPVDDGNLILSIDEAEYLRDNYPESNKLIKKYIGADEFVNGGLRYCLWITDEDKSLAYSIPFISNRLVKCQNFRLRSSKQSTRDLANFPYLFDERKYRPVPAIVVPQTGSERRQYLPMGMADSNTVLSNAVRVIYNGDLVLFGIIASYIHMVWVRAVAGRLKKDMQYSNTICYNAFPFPKLNSNELRLNIETAAKEVLLIRADHSEMTLAELYSPDTMPNDLLEAHHALDLAVERCYREKPFESDEERLEFLFKQYVKLTTEKSALWKI